MGWRCRWCDRALGVLASPTGLTSVLICPHCDFSHQDATAMPRENEIRDQRPEDWGSHA